MVLEIKQYGLLHHIEHQPGLYRSQIYLFEDISEIMFFNGYFKIFYRKCKMKDPHVIYIAVHAKMQSDIHNAFTSYLEKEHEQKNQGLQLQKDNNAVLSSIDSSLKALLQQIELAPGNQEFTEAQDRQIKK
jgi:hypothetical protein